VGRIGLDENMKENYEAENQFFRAHWEICSCCKGRGIITDPPGFGSGFTDDDFADDPDFVESYMQGTYDVPCDDCRGAGKVLVPDVEVGNQWKEVFTIRG
jgi:hypothetical protein